MVGATITGGPAALIILAIVFVLGVWSAFRGMARGARRALGRDRKREPQTPEELPEAHSQKITR